MKIKLDLEDAMETLAEKRYRLAPGILRQPPSIASRIFTGKCLPSSSLLEYFASQDKTMPENYIAENVEHIGLIVTDNKWYSGNSSKQVAAIVRDYDIDPEGHDAFMALLASEIADIEPEALSAALEEMSIDLILDREGSLGLGKVDRLDGRVYLDGDIVTNLPELSILSNSIAEAIETETWAQCAYEIMRSAPRDWLWNYSVRSGSQGNERSICFTEAACELSFGMWHPSVVEDELGQGNYKIIGNDKLRPHATGFKSYDEHCLVAAKELVKMWKKGMAARGLIFDYYALKATNSLEDVGRFCGIDSMVSARIAGVSLEEIFPDSPK